MKFLLSIFILFYSITANSQDDQDSLSRTYILKVRKQIEVKDFVGAQSTLKKIYNLKSTVPDEVAFRYGQVQLGLNNYVKAEDAFEKYLYLTEGKGEFTKQCDSLLTVTGTKICKKCHNSGYYEIVDTCLICNGKGKNIVACKDCGGKGKMICPVCGGQGVVLISSSLGPIYQACAKCQGKGISNCVYCSGSCKREVFCNNCKGKGFSKRRISCNHQH